MRVLAAGAACAIALYVIDAVFFNGQYFEAVSRLGRELASMF